MGISRSRLVAAVVLAATLVSCTGSPSPGIPADDSITPSVAASAPPVVASGGPASSPTAEPAASIPPTIGDSFPILGMAPQRFAGSITCSGSIGPSDPVALVHLQGAADGTSVLRDYSSVGKPRTACTLVDVAVVQLIDPRHIVIVDIGPDAPDHTFAVVDLPAVRFHWFQLPGASTEFLAVAPGRSQVAWRRTGSKDDIHVATASGDTVVAKLPDTNLGRCGAPSDSNNAAYTRSGSALFVLDEPLPEISLLVVKGTKVRFSDPGTASAKPSTRPLFVLWSPTDEVLYFAKSGSVWRWSESLGLTIFLPGVTWDAATISADGANLAYQVTTASGSREIWLVDLAHGGSPTKISKSDSSGPVFLNARQLLYFSSAADQGCTGTRPLKPVIYDVVSRAQARSIIDQVEFIWPATGTHN
jgi:hypothetical protein